VLAPFALHIERFTADGAFLLGHHLQAISGLADVPCADAVPAAGVHAFPHRSDGIQHL
jgi:hypothetical protein